MDSKPEAGPDEPALLLSLPSEILAVICRHLPNKDIKALRLASPSICHAVPPRFTRVFLSPDPRNLAVFRAVAAHKTFRLGVREIVFDDARLADPGLRLDRYNDAGHDEPDDGFDDVRVPGEHEERWGEGMRPAAREGAMFAWFDVRSERNLRELHGRNVNDTGNTERQMAMTAQRNARPPLEESYEHYLKLLREQNKAMAAREDVKALVEGIEAFPALERIAVTPATHGFLYTPLYYTPMIRNLPYGFNYPMPRGWPTSKEPTALQALGPWVPGPEWTAYHVRAEKARWRGLLLVLQTLAERIRNGQDAAVSELVMDVHSLNTGVSPYMLAQECEERDNLALILRQPSFRRLDLPIVLAGVRHDDVALLENGLLKGLLAEARHLQHFRLRGDGQADPNSPSPRRFFELRSLLPLDTWTQLRHFGLSKFVVRVANLVGALGALPRTLRSVELSFLEFDAEGQQHRRNHCALLDMMKMSLDWASWPEEDRPKVTMGMAKVSNNVDGRGLWFSEEISEFFYGSGRNPFDWHRDILLPGMGWLADEYDEDFWRPYAAYKDYRALWYNEGAYDRR